MSIQPPWANELRARNRKVGRNIWSTSDLHERTSFDLEKRGDLFIKDQPSRVDNPLRRSKGYSTTSQKSAFHLDSSYGDNIRHNNGGDDEMKENRTHIWTPTSSSSSTPNYGEESLIEYGPGIVSKLRSKYQSLALRSASSRPSLLQRSTSLENNLDLESVGGSSSGICSPEPPQLNSSESRAFRGNMTLNIPPVVCSGRNNSGEASRQSRMRRARSVDALHSSTPEEYSRHEEEILEKFKTVVLPKEEIVIIELSKPREESSSEFVQNNNNSVLSPQDELPPHDIVRETARMFERNPTHSSSNSESSWKRIVNSNRTKSPTTDSPALSPTPPILNGSNNSERKFSKNNSIQDAVPRIMSMTHNNNQHTNKNKVSASVQSANQNNIVLSPTKQIGIIRPTVNGMIKSEIVMSSPNRPNILQKPTIGPKPFGKTFRESVEQSKVPTSSLKSVSNREINLITQNDKNKEMSRSPSPLLLLKDKDKSRSFSPSLSPLPNPTTLKTSLSLQSSILPPKSNIDKSSDDGGKELKSIHLKKPSGSKMEEESNFVSKQGYNDRSSSPIKLISKEKLNAREGDALRNKEVIEKEENLNSPPPSSQLRIHQRQKLSNGGGSGSMVFNFTSRNKVPDYIEDDGLHRMMGINGTVMDESSDDAVDSSERIDPKLIRFIGANVIINGKSSLQKKPKSQKMSIKFNEEGTTTFEYPSESSILSDEAESTTSSNSNSNSFISQNSSSMSMNLSGGSTLASYTPSKVSTNNYQLGSYRDVDGNSNRKLPSSSSDKDFGYNSNTEVVEEHFKPNSEGTTWSNEMGNDILF